MDLQPLNTAIQRCRSYLHERLAAGEYNLYTAVSGEVFYPPIPNAGHVFAGFFIVDALKGELSAAEEARLLLRLHRERRGGVWGYSTAEPVDVDDSAFVYRTLLRLGKSLSVEPLLRFYRADARAFTTFRFDGPTRLVEEPHVDGNHQIHAAVNANVFALMLEAGRRDLVHPELILGSQRADGSWGGYFYPGPYYATTMSVEFLVLLPELAAAVEARERAVRFLESAQAVDGSWGEPASAYDTALALNALVSAAPASRCIRPGIEFLLRRQRADGSWENDATVWEYYHRMEPETVWRALDCNRVLVSALALKSLKGLAPLVS